MTATAVAACAVVLAACGVGGDRGEMDGARASTSTSAPAAGDLPDGWRWETYRSVQVAVPDTFGWGNGTQRLGQWCVDRGGRGPIVGRPGVSTLVGCVGTEASPPAETVHANTGTVVAFAPAPEGTSDGIGRLGDRVTVVTGGVEVVVQAPAGLRERIAATLRTVEHDANGCPVLDPVVDDPGRRPDEAHDLARLSGITAVASCLYDHRGRRDGGLASSVRLDGPEAATTVEAIATAPVAGDDPPRCGARRLGESTVVLRIDSALGESVAYLRYAGCARNGVDDGVAVRALRGSYLRPLLAGPNTPTSWENRGDPAKNAPLRAIATGSGGRG
ncbi:hypothetical protein CLV56_1685 [Mumia flava]|uniref:Uncharacterized protein n=1 Tax=Mumia flava TaxID=1348852 RepID=A0A0B2BJ27_9ACTN|nr:hypothetical protein [Mumia flava]PJJ57454.1 hypothetical protein CLV56_1685 [Mumia flava]